MARKDWINVGVSFLSIQAIDSFLKSEAAKITKVESRQNFVNKLLIEFFVNYERKTGIRHLPLRDEEKFPPTLFDLLTKKTKK